MFHVKHYSYSSINTAWRAGVKHFSLSEVLLYIFIFLLPWQTRILYNQDQAYVDWFFNYHLAIFVYLSDLVLVSCFIAFVIERRELLPGAKSIPSSLFWLILAFFGIILLTLFHVKRIDLGVYTTFKWLELMIIIFLLPAIINNIRVFKISAVCLLFAGLVQASMAIGQFHMQHSLGWGFLGEYISETGTQGLATINVGSDKLIRAYGSMPHPNILGGFLLVALSA